jgi:uncharacterized membrane protein YbhN (UPF0104 family)
VKRLLGIGFYLLVALFLFLYAQSLDFTGLSEIQLNVGFLIIATLLSLGVRFWFARIWAYFLSSMGVQISASDRRELNLVYAKAWLGRYVPGSIVWVAGKVYFASKLGIPKTKLAVSSYLEALIQLATTIFLAVLLIVADPLTRSLAGDSLWAMLALLGISVVALVPKVLTWYAGLGYRLIKKQKLDPQSIPGASVILQGSLRFTLSALVAGLAFYFVLLAIYPQLGFENLLYVLALTAIANALSMVAIFAPAGVGVREGVLIAGLALIIDPSIALLATLLMRVMSIIWDGLFFGIAKGLQAAK